MLHAGLRKIYWLEFSRVYPPVLLVKLGFRQVRVLRWAGHVARMEEGRGVHKVLVGKPEGKRPLGRPRRRWEDNIKMGSSGSGKGLWGLDGVG